MNLPKDALAGSPPEAATLHLRNWWHKALDKTDIRHRGGVAKLRQRAWRGSAIRWSMRLRVVRPPHFTGVLCNLPCLKPVELFQRATKLFCPRQRAVERATHGLRPPWQRGFCEPRSQFWAQTVEVVHRITAASAALQARMTKVAWH